MRDGLRGKKAKTSKKGLHIGILMKLVCSILLPLVIILGSIGIILNSTTSRGVTLLESEKLQLNYKYSAAQVESFFYKVFGVAET